MKKGSTLFLKFVILLIWAGALAGLVWFPQTEGRAQNLDLLSIYLDPFILYSFVASVPFFYALYQAFLLLGYIDQNKFFTTAAVRTLQHIKYSAMAVIGFIVIGQILLILIAQDDDVTGPVALGLYASFITCVFATGVAVAQRLLQSAVDLKSENDLTV
jgi:hypothetical protein